MFDSITTPQRTKINNKFDSLGQKFGLFEWQATYEDEQEALALFLLTSPTVNDVQEYLDERITNWTIAKSEVEHKKQIDKFIVVFEMLMGFVDRLK